jgi:ABC-2 type transport system permease protein
MTKKDFFYIQWIGFLTVIWREIRRIIRIWPQTLLPPVITTSLYFVIFGNLIGSRIGDINHLSYIDFITPGLVMMNIINNAYVHVSSSFFSAKFQNCIEELLISPMSSHTIILGYIFGGISRALINGMLVLLVSLFFTEITIHNIVLTLSLAILTAILFSLVGLINALFAKKFDDIAIVPMFILTPLTYLGGVFYDISFLPPFWQKVALINPILYIISGFRYAICGNADIDITFALIILACFVFISYAICWYFFKKGIGLRR